MENGGGGRLFLTLKLSTHSGQLYGFLVFFLKSGVGVGWGKENMEIEKGTLVILD